MNKVVDSHEACTFAEEALVVDVQIFLHNLMEEKGMSRANLAKAMGVSRARVTQMLSDECQNLTVRLLARAAHALGEAVELDCEHFRLKRQAKEAASASGSANVYQIWSQIGDVDDVDVVQCDVDDRLLGFINSSQERRVA